MALLDKEYSLFGVDATYTPSGGVGVAVTVTIDEGEDLSDDGGVVRHVVLIKVRQSEIAARPGYRDAFVLVDGAGTSQTFKIVDDGVKELRASGAMGGEWACDCSRKERLMI